VLCFLWYELTFIISLLAQGNRLGSAGDQLPARQATNTRKYEDNPKPIIDKNLTGEERVNIRAERAAAAEARAKKNQIGGKKKKSKIDPSAPLRGPNSKNTMNWTM
jgi:hypothetical protein